MTWLIEVDIPDSLNFAIYLRNLYMQQVNSSKNNSPFSLDDNQKFTDLWEKWWKSILRARTKYVGIDRFGIDPASFASLKEMPELQIICQNNWSSFAKWWYNDGGKKELTKILTQYHWGQQVKNFEHMYNCKMKPFELKIDIVIGYVNNIKEISNCYTIIDIVSFQNENNITNWLFYKLRNLI